MIPRRALFALAFVAGTAGCSSSTEVNPYLQLVATFQQQLANRNAEPQRLGPDIVAAALEATDEPVAFAAFTERPAEFVTRRIGRNGPFETFSTSSGQAFILRSGVIAGTRGLGADLMSSDTGPLTAAVARRTRGTVDYTIRYLTAEDQTVEQTLTCVLSPGAAPIQPAPVAMRGIDTFVTADCNNPDLRFTNTYAVTGGGQIVASQQFLTPELGMIGIQRIQR
jgi:Protein of unknown function (DUF2886).